MNINFNKMTINNRIAQIISDLDLSVNAFAKKCEINTTTLQNIVSGRSKPGFEFLEKILNRYPQIDSNSFFKDKGGTEPIEKIMSRNDALSQIETLINELKQE